jgi:polysaccharide biosynthesis protein PslH
MRLLFVSPAELDRPRGGRAMLGRLHRDALARCLGDGFAAHRLVGAGSALDGLRGFLDGATPAGIAAALAAVDAHAASAVWLDGSNLGRLAQALRRTRPEVRVLTFCHNVESRFFWGALRRRLSPRAAAVLAGNWAAERLAIRHSHAIVALSARDGALLRRLYGRNADHLLPMAVADQLDVVPPPDARAGPDAPFLFVGGAFYANQAGIAWFARAVAPRIDARVEVVGHGIDAMRDVLEAVPNVRVLGAVDALAPVYARARAVLAPIFDGSGMKTKVAEALMFGKRVIGTAEAFSGYEAVADRAGWRCDTADAFVAAISAARAADLKVLDPSLRALYARDHSPDALDRRLPAILDRRATTWIGGPEGE